MKTKTIEEIEMSKRIGKVYNYSVDLCEKISENDQFARVVTSRYLTNIQNGNQVEYDETFERMLKDYTISKNGTPAEKYHCTHYLIRDIYDELMKFSNDKEEQTYLESIFRKYSSLIKVPKAFKMIDDMPDIKEEEAKPKKR